jgi:hypothetical protein
MRVRLLASLCLASIPAFCTTGLDDPRVCGDFNVIPRNAAPGDTTTVPERVCMPKSQMDSALRRL